MFIQVLSLKIMDKIKKFNKSVNEIKKLFPENSNYLNEKIVEHSMCTNLIIEKNTLLDWYKKISSKKIDVEIINLNEMNSWELSNEKIMHNSKKFFQVRGLRVNNTERENQRSWDQPILEEINYDGGLLGLVRGLKNGLPHYLVEAKFEPGNYNQYQLSPTLQATFSNLSKAMEEENLIIMSYLKITMIILKIILFMGGLVKMVEDCLIKEILVLLKQ